LLFNNLTLTVVFSPFSSTFLRKCLQTIPSVSLLGVNENRVLEYL
jgi:hypothetical protein